VSAREALMAEIRARPEDDAPRLVLADLLQQQGDPYGEFIALQCAAAGGDESGELRERALWAAHGASWCELLGVEREHVEFRRGFVEKVLQLDAPSEALREHPVQSLHIDATYSRTLSVEQARVEVSWAEALRPRELVVSAWQQTGQPPLAEVLLRPLLLSEAVSRLRHLELSAYLFDPSLIDRLLLDLASHAALGELRSFHLTCPALDAEPLVSFLSASPCRGLQKVELFSRPEVVERALGVLPPSLTQLRARLDLRQSRLGSWPGLRAIEELGLFQDGQGAPDLPALLAACPQLSGLGLTGFGRLTACLPSLPAFARLRRLTLRDDRLSPDDVVALFDGPWTRSLQQLALPGSYLRGGRAFAHLGQVLGRPDSLDLSHTGLDDEGLREIARHGALEGVRELQLPRVSEGGLALVADAAPSLRVLRLRALALPALRVLSTSLAERVRELSMTMDLDDAQLSLLADAPFVRLRALRLSGSASGLGRLRSAPWFPALERAQLREVAPSQARR
jgi:uncharacterized protein (TIGR02996 family)